MGGKSSKPVDPAAKERLRIAQLEEELRQREEEDHRHAAALAQAEAEAEAARDAAERRERAAREAERARKNEAAAESLIQDIKAEYALRIEAYFTLMAPMCKGTAPKVVMDAIGSAAIAQQRGSSADMTDPRFRVRGVQSKLQAVCDLLEMVFGVRVPSAADAPDVIAAEPVKEPEGPTEEEIEAAKRKAERRLGAFFAANDAWKTSADTRAFVAHAFSLSPSDLKFMKLWRIVAQRYAHAVPELSAADDAHWAEVFGHPPEQQLQASRGHSVGAEAAAAGRIVRTPAYSALLETSPLRELAVRCGSPLDAVSPLSPPRFVPGQSGFPLVNPASPPLSLRLPDQCFPTVRPNSVEWPSPYHPPASVLTASIPQDSRLRSQLEPRYHDSPPTTGSAAAHAPPRRGPFPAGAAAPPPPPDYPQAAQYQRQVPLQEAESVQRAVDLLRARKEAMDAGPQHGNVRSPLSGPSAASSLDRAAAGAANRADMAHVL